MLRHFRLLPAIGYLYQKELPYHYFPHANISTLKLRRFSTALGALGRLSISTTGMSTPRMS